MLVSDTIQQLQKLLDINDQTELRSITGSPQRESPSSHDWLLSRVTEFIGLKETETRGSDSYVVQQLSHHLIYWHGVLINLRRAHNLPSILSPSGVYRRLLEGKQLAILAAKLPPDPYKTSSAQQTITQMELLVASRLESSPSANTETQLSIADQLLQQRIEKLQEVVTPLWKSHLEHLWESGDKATLERISPYLSISQAVHLWGYAQEKLEGAGAIYLLFSSNWSVAKQLLLSLDRSELIALIRCIDDSIADFAHWFSQQIHRQHSQQHEVSKQLLDAVKTLEERLQILNSESSSDSDQRDIEAMITELKMERSALILHKLAVQALSKDIELPKGIQDLIALLDHSIKESQKLQQTIRWAEAFPDEGEELCELLPRWGIWSFEECREFGLLQSVPDEKLAYISSQGQHFVKACSYLKTLGISEIDDLKKLDICNKKELSHYLAKQASNPII